MCWVEVASAIGNLGTFLAGIAVAWAAFYKAPKEYSEWKSREIFKVDRERAIEILAAMNEGKSVINSIRSPLTSRWEIAEARKIIEETDVKFDEEEIRRQEQRIVTINRIKNYDEYWQKVYSLLPLAKVVFGAEVYDVLYDVLKVRQEIFAAVETYPRAQKHDLLRKFEAVFWAGAYVPGEDDEDKIEKRIEAGEKKLEELLVKQIQG